MDLSEYYADPAPMYTWLDNVTRVYAQRPSG